MRTATRVLSSALFLLSATLPAAASDLSAFLERAERMTTVNEKVQADITIREADGSTRKAVLILDPAAGGTQVFEQTDTGWRSETPLAWTAGKVVRKSGEAPGKIDVDEPLAGTDLRGIDFFPFWKTDYTKSYISDENTQEETVSIYAGKDQPYSLYVITFDKAKLFPRMFKYYKDTFSNMVRIRTDKNHVMVGSRPRPTEILIRDFATNTLRTYTLEWKLVDATAK